MSDDDPYILPRRWDLLWNGHRSLWLARWWYSSLPLMWESVNRTSLLLKCVFGHVLTHIVNISIIGFRPLWCDVKHVTFIRKPHKINKRKYRKKRLIFHCTNSSLPNGWTLCIISHNFLRCRPRSGPPSSGCTIKRPEPIH